MLFLEGVAELLENLAESITFFLIRNKTIDLDESEIYVYGFQVILSSLIVTVSLILIGILLDEMNLTLVFMSMFALLRSYSGGFHCNKFKNCLLTSTSLLIIELILNEIINYDLKVAFCLPILLVASIVIYIFSPVEDKNNPLSEVDKERYRKITRGLIIVISLITFIGFFIAKGLIDYLFIVSLTLMFIAILLIIPILKNKK